jgi:hypothetical protein
MAKRQGAAVAVAVAVLMITAGAGVAVWRSGGDDTSAKAPKAVARTAPLPGIRAMTAVGAPVPAPKGGRWNQVVAADGRIYAATERDDSQGGAFLIAFDATSGKRLWTSQRFGVFMDYGGPIAFPGGLLVRVENTIHFLDPATGKVRWKFGWKNKDEYAVDGRTFVRMNAAGTTDGFDLSSGERLWSTPAGADRPVRTTGMQTGGYERIATIFGPEIAFADEGLVQVTAGGRVTLRDMRTGTEQQAVDAGLPGAWSTVAYQGRVWTDFQGNDGGPYVLRVTDLAGGATSDVWTAPNGIEARNPEPCGMDRICLRQWDNVTSEASVVVAGAPAPSADRKTFQVAPYLRAGPGGTILTDLVTTVVHGPDGEPVHTGPGSGRWVDANNVLWEDDKGLSALSIPDGVTTPLLDSPGRLGNCALTAERLACPVETNLQIWRFVR